MRHNSTIVRPRRAIRRKEKSSSPDPIVKIIPPLPRDGLPVRVGIITPALGLGGAERWMIDMVNHVKNVRWQGVATLNTHINDEQIVKGITDAGVPLYEHEEGILKLISICDVCLTWGIPNSSRFFAGTSCKRICVSQGTAKSPHTIAAHADATPDDICVGISPYAKEAFPELVRDQCTIIPLAPDASRCITTKSKSDIRKEWGIPEGKKILGYLGRLVYNKYPEGLIKAIFHLPENWVGVVAGQGPFRKEMEKLAEQLNVSHRICFVGPHYDVGNVLNAFDWCYFGSNAEGFGLVFVESWMMGTPVLATSTGAAGMFPECVTTIPFGDDGKKAAQTILKHDGTKGLKKKVKNAREFSLTQCTMQSFAKNWEDLLKKAGGDRRIRLGILHPVLTRGGAEHSSFNWAKYISNEKMRYVGSAVLRENHLDDEVRAEYESLGVVYTCSQGARQLAGECDVLMSWGIANPAQYTEGTSCKVIQTSRGNDSEFTRNAMLGCEDAVAIVAVSPSSLQGVPEPQRGRVVIIPNMVEETRLRATQSRETTLKEIGIDPGQKVIGMVGRLDNNKNQKLLIEATRFLPAKWTVLLAGAGSRKEIWEEEARTLFGEDQKRVVFIDPRKDIGNIYKALECLVILSKNEGFCNVMAEGWICEVPVIGTQVGMAEQRPDLIYRVSFEDDGPELAKAILTDSKQTVKRKRRIKAAGEYAKDQLTPDAFCRKWRDVIESVQ